jgi:ferredoxin-NADP reductase
VDALLYRPGGDRERIRRALEIPALSAGWRTSLQAILDEPPGASGNAGLAAAGLAPNAQRGFRTARIAALTRITADVLSVGLEAADQSDLDAARPGQFLALKAQVSPTSAPLIRSYSIAGTPNAKRYELGVKCERDGAMGRYLSRANVGDRFEMSSPRGAFVLRATERPVVFMSAGIGITPVLAMLKALVAQRSSRKVWWLYGARNGAEHPFATEVRMLLAQLANAASHVRYSRPVEGDLAGRDFDSRGRVDAALVRELGIEPGCEFYLCGPATFSKDLTAGLEAAGIPSEDIFGEVFGTGPALAPGIVGSHAAVPHGPVGPPGTGPVVSFSRSGLNVPWSARYTSLLDFAEACDVPVRWSCRSGVCHTCESGLISGDVTYEPPPLQPPGDGNVLICCSTPSGALVLDL